MARYRAQGTGADHDRDVFTLLDLEAGDAARDPWTATLVARLAKDLDGNRGAGDSPFTGADDAFDSSLTARVYEAHVDLHDVPGVEAVRFGRQALVETPESVTFDGVSADSKPAGDWKQSYGVYGGQTVHYFESSPRGDAVYGAWLVDQPWTGGRTRLDWMHLEDRTITGSNEDDLVAVQLRQALPPALQLQGDYSWFGSSPRDIRLGALWHDKASDVLVQGSYYELLRTQNDLVEELDPFSSMLFAQFPFKDTRLVASKSWGGDFDLEGGVDVRRVTDSADVTDFNRDFERYHLTGTQHHVLVDGLSLGVTGEVWQDSGTNVSTWGFDATHEWSKRLKASLGSFYSLFKNDFFLGEERNDVRTWYARLKYVTEARTTWALGYEIENSSDGGFHTVTVGATWRF